MTVKSVEDIREECTPLEENSLGENECKKYRKSSLFLYFATFTSKYLNIVVEKILNSRQTFRH